MIRALSLTTLLATALPSGAVIFLDTADPEHNTATPGDNSGWQYEGKFGNFLGVPIGPLHFITAAHIGAAGTGLDFHGAFHPTVAGQNIPGTDLTIWTIESANPFPNYAPLSTGAADIGATATLIGRGTRRGDEIVVNGEPKGWKWDASDFVQRWGRNVVSQTASDPDLGEFLQCDFDKPGIPNECHLSNGDSGGGMFVLEGGLWRLAGINYAVDGPFRIPPATDLFNAALFDAGGFEYQDDPGFTLVPEAPENVASSFYSSRISASAAAILEIVPAAATLAAEDFTAWQSLYFSPAEIAAPTTAGPLADPDSDGISNLLEFALNLDPTFPEPATMTPLTGLRGLSVVGKQVISGEERVTIEFVRRTAGATYQPQFSSDLHTWIPAAAETVVPINPRWERVTAAAADPAQRFARLKVALPD